MAVKTKKKSSKKKSSKMKSLKKKSSIKKSSIKKSSNKFVIGMISVPLTPNKKYFKVCGDSYVSSTHIEWIKRHNISVLIIPHNTKNLKYYFDRIHGLYIPSGGAFATSQVAYYTVCKNLIKMAIRSNDSGYYFPIWGSCMGFQQMLIVADGTDNVNGLLNKFDSYKHYKTNTNITLEGSRSKIIKGIDHKTVHNITKNKSTLHNHMLGISPDKFNNRRQLSAFYKIVSTSKDRKGNEFVNMIEGIHYPFYGVQWHPEAVNTMGSLANFFIKEVRKNKRKVKRHKRVPLFTKKINCSNYSEGLYKKCNFYWHNRTSSHNRRMCSYAQLKDKDINTNGV
jgi:gamma-glutamyl hydrolase